MKNTSYVLKHPSTSKVNSVTPKKPKTSENVPQINPSTSLPLIGSPPVTSSQVMLSKGKHEIWHVKKNIIYTYILEMVMNFKTIISGHLRF